MKKIIIAILILSTLLLTGCIEESSYLNEDYVTIVGILYDYNEEGYTLYRMDIDENISYAYNEKLSYDIAKQLNKGELYYFDYHIYETKGNVDHIILLSIRNSENVTVWS